VGKYELVSAIGEVAERGGFYCELCDCMLKDDKSYLDHINGKKRKVDYHAFEKSLQLLGLY